MVKKNLFLTLLAISVVFGVQNYDLLITESGPFENGPELLGKRDPGPSLADKQAAVIQAGSPASAAPIIAPTKSIATVQKNGLPVETKAPASAEIGEEIRATDPKTVKSADGSQEFEMSEWLDVPLSVADRVRSIPLRSSLAANTVFSFAIDTTISKPSAVGKEVYYSEIGARQVVTEMFTFPTTEPSAAKRLVAKPSLRPFLLAESAATRVSSSIATRPLTPLLPGALTQTFSMTETTSSKVSSVIVGRPLLPLLPDEVAGRSSLLPFLVAETKSSKVSSEIYRRPLLPLLPDAFVGKRSPLVETSSLRVSSAIAAPPLFSLLSVPVTKAPVKKPRTILFDLVETTSSPVSTAIVARALLPLIPEAVTAKASMRSFPLTKTTSSMVTTAIVGRALLPLLPEAVAAKPLPRVFASVETTSSRVSTEILQRPLLKTIPEIVAAKPRARTFSLAETTSSSVSTAILGRPLMPLIPESVAAKVSALAETTSSPVSTAILGRPLMPLIPESVARTLSLAETTSSSVSSGITVRPLLPLFDVPVYSRQMTAIAKTDTKPAPGSIDAALTAVNISPTRNENPVAINGQRTFSQSLLGPLGFIPTLSQMASSSDAPETTTSGPSIETSVAKENTTAANPTKASAQPLPVMITAQSGFSLDMLKPLSSRSVFPPNPDAVSSVSTQTVDGYCDPNFVGPPIRFSQTVELKLEDLINQLNSRFGVNFIVGPGISDLPLNVKAGSIPWNVLLRSQLYVSGVRAQCIDSNTIELVLNSRVAELEKAKVNAEKLETRYIKLKYLQPSASGNKNIAGQSTGGGGSTGGNIGSVLCQSASSSGGQGGSALGFGGGGGGDQLPQRCKFERLMSEIRQILGLNDRTSAPGDRGLLRGNVITVDQSSTTPTPAEVPKQAYVGQVPGRNMLIVNATTGQLREIDELIKRADIPPFQVVIKGLVYTANEDKLKDIGVQTTIANIGKGDTTGGLFGHTSGILGTLFDFSTLIGTVQFQVQANALQRDGVISIKSRPFATVLDGDTTDLTVGRQVPVLVQAVNPIGGAAPGLLQILQAANLLSVTPHVIDDDQGNPVAVNLELQLESNDVDTSIDSQGIPAVSVRSIQSNFNLNLEQTAILGGFTVDSDSKTVSKTPGLGDIPIIGELFKRRVRASQINRLYFAISVTVIPYGGKIEPVSVPGATPDPPSLTPVMKKRADAAEPKQVVDPK